MRFFILLVALTACRPEPIPLNPHKKSRQSTGQIEHDVSESEAPPAVVKKRDGSEFDLAALWDKTKEQKVVVVFYRGGWCPHCKRQLAELQENYRLFLDAKATVVGVSNEDGPTGTALRESLGLGFELYSDPELAMITKWGVEDFEQKIAKPATFVVQPGGMITYRKVGANPADHPSMDDLRAALK